MLSYNLNDLEKLRQVIANTALSRSEIARRLGVRYKTVYRWLDKKVIPHPSHSRAIDDLFRKSVDLKAVVLDLHKAKEEPLSILKSNKAPREKFLLEATYHSIAIEGNYMSMGETKSALEGRTVKRRGFFEILEAINHRNALMFLLDNTKPDFAIKEEFILRLHEIVMYNFNDSLPGKYKTERSDLVDKGRLAASSRDLQARMREFLKNVNSYGEDIIEKIARDHHEFEAVHPFCDGNGRVGRLIMITQLLSKGLSPAIVQIEEKPTYIAVLREADLGNFKGIVQMVCDAIIRGHELLRET